MDVFLLLRVIVLRLGIDLDERTSDAALDPLLISGTWRAWEDMLSDTHVHTYRSARTHTHTHTHTHTLSYVRTHTHAAW